MNRADKKGFAEREIRRRYKYSDVISTRDYVGVGNDGQTLIITGKEKPGALSLLTMFVVTWENGCASAEIHGAP